MVFQLDLSNNQLCGIDYTYGRGTYTAEGITAIADAMRVNGVLTSLNLSSNDIGGYWDDDQKTRVFTPCLLYTSPSPRDRQKSRMPSSA